MQRMTTLIFWLRWQIVLVDQSDRFVFKPLLYELLSKGTHELYPFGCFWCIAPWLIVGQRMRSFVYYAFFCVITLSIITFCVSYRKDWRLRIQILSRRHIFKVLHHMCKNLTCCQFPLLVVQRLNLGKLLPHSRTCLRIVAYNSVRTL